MPELTIVESWRVMIVRSVGLDLLPPNVEVDLLRAALVGDVEDDQPARLQLVGDDLLGLGLDLPGGLRAR